MDIDIAVTQVLVRLGARSDRARNIKSRIELRSTT
jgi:hypothetical protein